MHVTARKMMIFWYFVKSGGQALMPNLEVQGGSIAKVCALLKSKPGASNIETKLGQRNGCVQNERVRPLQQNPVLCEGHQIVLRSIHDRIASQK